MKQYLGDQTRMVVHNLLAKTPDCRLEGIPKEARKEWDALYEATNAGFTKCPSCIGDRIW